MSTIPVLVAEGTPSEMGAAHGTAFAEQIRTYMEERVRLSAEGTDLDRAGIVGIAESMLDHHRRYDPDLHTEMEAMADAAGITPAEALIVGGYTDFIDTVRSLAHGTALEDTCTALLTSDERSDGAGFLAQTWDMHASATPHVFMLDVRPTGAPHALIFTTHGTLGQIGMNEAGIAVGINNLTMDDGGLGVTWPFAVRKALRQTDIESAVTAITDATLAGGHNFLVLDGAGRGVSIEATRTETSIEWLTGDVLSHTNHCLAPNVKRVEAERPLELVESSASRLVHVQEFVEATNTFTFEGLIELLRDERSICRRAAPPFNFESSGAVVLRPKTFDLWACWGIPSDNEFEHFSVGTR